MSTKESGGLARLLDRLCAKLGMAPMQDPDYQLRGRWWFWFKNLVTGQPHLSLHDGQYLRRWWLLPKNRWFNVYLHHFKGPDQGAFLHDHPYDNVSIILRGSYVEERFIYSEPAVVSLYRLSPHKVDFSQWDKAAKVHEAGAVIARSAASPHTIKRILSDGGVWTLFVTGPAVRVWGFYTNEGWKPWRKALGLAE